MNISVFITSYNQHDYLKEAIDSVLAQTLPPRQIIVVDDASRDGSQDLIADYTRNNPKIFTPIYHRQNTGVAQVRIDALNAVRGDYVTYVDGDDWFLPEKLALEAKALKSHPDARIAFSNNAYMSADGKKMLWIWVDGEEVPEGDVFRDTVSRTFPRHSLFRMELVHYESWRRTGFHDPKLNLYEDFDMRIRLTGKFQAVYVDKILSHIRTHGTGLSSLQREHHFKALNYIYHKNLPLINSLPENRRRMAIKELAGWISQIGHRAAKEAWEAGRITKYLQLKMGAYQYKRRTKHV